MSVTTCRVCEGDGFVAADSDTPMNERVTRDSRRCPYCSGKGYTTRRGGFRPGSGRKPQAEAPRTILLRVMCSPTEYAELYAHAGNEPLSTWLRDLGLADARRKRRS